MWNSILAVLFLIVITMVDWVAYQTRGRTRPDTPGEEEYTMITGSQDAMAHRIIDLVGKGKKQTKK